MNASSMARSTESGGAREGELLWGCVGAAGVSRAGAKGQELQGFIAVGAANFTTWQ